MKLIYNNGEGFVEVNGVNWSISAKPDLGFPYDGIFFNTGNGTAIHLRAGGQGPMSPAEIAAVTSYLAGTTAPVFAPPSAAERKRGLKVAVENAIQQLLDSTAQTHGYDTMLTLCSYRDSANATFASEAAAGLAWRDAVWTYFYAQLALVQSGGRSIPTIAQFMAELPAIAW